ncbi:exonuclease SbcCD subunit D [Lederbergia wuyishanensis]|uniref:DNA repair exonuclease SbcCD nuclease subunit n=1 Tax=Lederbergia wuyishanensis TaxID=1347903 RepID=A0ABU0CYN6_9BACI|nr:DNA repair exonuclease [Lederbergia wuyishanensis]MCJ8005894.1 DNA repair exonuclease [Lederbergia wuyishanensis]MDQ0341260.1 DNA repair exonuclease SbcCD nuclease subunit [Lederbergia wuyishanensis]
MDGIRFIHTADLHLDSPFIGLKHLPKELFNLIQESTFNAFEKVIDAAIDDGVDFIVIVGDLFDGEDRSIKAQARLRKQMERLKEKGINAFVLHGNHDHLQGNWATLNMPENVFVFGKDIEMMSFISKRGDKVHLYGFSYGERHIVDRKVLEYQKLGSADFHIGLLHGHCEGGTSLHQPYAPFTIQELLKKDMDYWALGHIHTRQVLHENPFLVYPGNIQGRHKNEQGTKGCYHVSLSKSGLGNLSFIETAAILWETVNIYCDENITLTELYNKCKEEMESSMESNQKSIMMELNLHFQGRLSNEITSVLDNGDFLEMLQDGIDFHELFVWPYALHKCVTVISDHQDSFFKNLNATVEEMEQEDTFEEIVSSLFSHIYGRRYLIKLEEEEKKGLYEEAKELIVSSIAREGR